METIVQRLQEKIGIALKKAFGSQLANHLELLQVELTQSQFAHYQCNNPLKLAKVLHLNPRDVAQKILDQWVDLGLDLGSSVNGSKSVPMVHKLEIAGPGFINITLATLFLEAEMGLFTRDPRIGVPLTSDRKRIIVEFSSPNIAKELHVGHLRSTIIGDSLARLFEFLGHDVLRLNHIGDWGTQFGMLIAFLKQFHPEFLSGKERVDLSTLMGWYRAAKKEFDQSPRFKKQSQLEVVRLQGGDEASLEAWGMICDVSREAFAKIYRLLDVQIEERGESFYNPFLFQVVEDLERRGLITLSNGAKCIFLEGFKGRDGSPLPMIIQKSDGGYNYDTTDMAAMRHRIEQEGADRIIIVTDGGQSLHFQMVEEVAKKAGYLDPAKVQFDHVPFGVVLGPDGKKFKTRSGETEKLIDLIDQAIIRATKLFAERLPETQEEEIAEFGKILGIDALKYADLSSHRLKDYQFSYERMLRFEGNTAPFLLYAYVRIQGIKRKVGKQIDPNTCITLKEPTEIALALHLLRFSEALEAMAKDLLPNRLCGYLYVLAEMFHAFFRDCRVEGSDCEMSRLILCEQVSRVLLQGFHILGLKPLSKM